MVNQKAISFKITLENLENLDDMISRSSRWTRRNTELNSAVEMYVMYQRARETYNRLGDTKPMREFISSYFSKYEKSIFG